MGKTTKIWLIIAASLVLIGCIVFVGVMVMLKWDFAELSTSKYETNGYEINENYQGISIVTDTADITFVPSEDSKCYVECREQKNLKHSVTVKDGTLVIKLVDTRKWYEYVGINFGESKITVSVPQGEYGTLSIKSSTGDVDIPKDFKFESIDVAASTGDVRNAASASDEIRIKTTTGRISVENVSAGSMDLSVSTGNVTVGGVTCEGEVKVGVSTGKASLTDLSCQKLTSEGNTGDLSLKNVIVSEKLSVERSTGDVRLDACDAAEIFVKTDTGDVTGTLLSDKVFITKTDTGDVNVPNAITGGRCEIITDTGDIRISIQQAT